MDVNQFAELIQRLQSSDNEIRKKAEEQYEQIDGSAKVALLFECYNHFAQANDALNFQIRSTVLVFLRRVLSRDWDAIWDSLNDENKQRILAKVLEMIVHESDISIKKKIADLISEIASNLIDDSGEMSWQGVLELMDHCLKSDDLTANYIALLILRGCPIIFGNRTAHFLPALKTVLEKCMATPDLQIKSTAVRAAVAFAVDNDEEKDVIRLMTALVPNVLQVCNETSDEDDADGALGEFAELASALPKCLNSHMNQVLSVCLALAGNKDKNEMARQNAIEVICSYMESAPKGLKKYAPGALSPILETLLSCMTELDDEVLNEWLNEIEEEDDYEDVPIIAESAIDRVACCINGKVMLPAFLPLVEKLLSNDDWKMKHAALRAFSAVGEGCQRSMEPHIEQIMVHITKYVNDAHPRVQYAACNAIGQMSSDFAPTLQKKCHAAVIPALLESLDRTDVPRVCAHAASALVNFAEECPKSIIGQYLPYILQKLENVLSAVFNRLADKRYQVVVENIVTAIASVAEAAEELFKEHHARLIPNLVHILQNVGELKELRGKTIECISLIGYAVGKEHFHSTAIDILNLLGDGMKDLAIDDPQYSYMISSWTRFCSILGSDFAPFLPVVMEPVLRAARYRPDFNIFNNEDIQETEEGVEYHGIGGEKTVGIRTSGLEEKATACDMLVAFAKEMKEAFMPYVLDVYELAIKNLDFGLHDGVRTASAEIMPFLLVCVEKQGMEDKRRLWCEFLKALTTAMEEEDDVEILASFMSAIGSCIEVMKTEGVAPEEVKLIISVLLKQLENYGKRMSDRPAEDEDDDDAEAKEELDYFMELEASCLGAISDLTHSLMKEFKGDIFEGMINVFDCAIQLIEGSKQYFERQWGMCLLDDAIEFGVGHLPTRFPKLIPIMYKLLGDEYPEVRQAASYGFGVMAIRYHQVADYKNEILSCLEPLAAMIQREDARATEESTVATENAISAFSKIIANVPLPQEAYGKVVEMFLSWLPTYSDTEESPYIYAALAELFDKQDPALFGHENQNLPRIFLVCLLSIANEAFNDDEHGQHTKRRIEQILKTIYASFPQFAQQDGVDEHLQGVLQRVLSGQ
ncbi:hypothetical protein L5515_000248 [Caenorhabditis briggsae]|uniref:Importin N-terminal domain-containing protein n=1 Tax=Caenorhabditis briggsae TaxID=6238 RepID=A0AAE9J1G2_CAEBR|nr:hypothetical protein L3Y34_014157 [Caenorhabditis briggsae]UMM10510.1 hypothetical protein L5515_000248 [Caenorhabditis briggsae]